MFKVLCIDAAPRLDSIHPNLPPLIQEGKDYQVDEVCECEDKYGNDAIGYHIAGTRRDAFFHPDRFIRIGGPSEQALQFIEKSIAV